MSEPALPPEGAVLVVATAEDAARWAPLVADRNASGQRTALLIAEPGDDAAGPRAAAMAGEIFPGAPFLVVEARGGHSSEGVIVTVETGKITEP